MTDFGKLNTEETLDHKHFDKFGDTLATLWLNQDHRYLNTAEDVGLDDYLECFRYVGALRWEIRNLNEQLKNRSFSDKLMDLFRK